MKNKASLVLMEQLVMILVFSLTAAICLGIFVKANQISRQSEDLDAAVILAQNAAEVLKASRGDWVHACEKLGGHLDGDTLLVNYNRQLQPGSNGTYTLYMRKKQEEIPLLGQAELWIVRTTEPDLPVFSLTVSWQEAA